MEYEEVGKDYGREIEGLQEMLLQAVEDKRKSLKDGKDNWDAGTLYIVLFVVVVDVVISLSSNYNRMDIAI